MRTSALSGVLAFLLACGPSQTATPSAAQGEAGSLLPQGRVDLPRFGFVEFQALLGELRGTPVVVNIWGSWCPPCQVEAPDLAEVAREFEGRVQFVGVDILDSRGPARSFILVHDWPYPSVF
ncbi:MAG: redoxin domain-containing protein, partial [Actinomycetota bacterium]